MGRKLARRRMDQQQRPESCQRRYLEADPCRAAGERNPDRPAGGKRIPGMAGRGDGEDGDPARAFQNYPAGIGANPQKSRMGTAF